MLANACLYNFNAELTMLSFSDDRLTQSREEQQQLSETQ